ncbi:hypothetical protein ACFY0G_40805 [Streptomyces sp. NPDC001552]|uniref:hypothetical protein n=1 Tax=Streptomyces sp. NPDC001552 TaxID=3364587 RepID=UPI0036952C6E
MAALPATQGEGGLVAKPDGLPRLEHPRVVIDPEALGTVAYGDGGRVLAHHVSTSFFLPSNLERDTAIRIEPLAGHIGDAVADVDPVDAFEDQAVIEGVY